LNKRIIYILLIPIALILAVQTWWSFGSVYKLQELEEKAVSISNDTLSLTNHPSVTVISRENAFKTALWSLATSDSIHLIVNLKDTSVGLFINGVLIHQTKPKSFEMDQLFKYLSNKAYLAHFEKPIRITKDSATIVKEPIVVREAPKDTIEAALNAYNPDTLIQNPAFWIIEMPNGLQLIFAQVAETVLEKKAKSEFFNQMNKSIIKDNWKRLTSFQRPLYTPVIKIELPADDLRAIYRALPNQGSLVLYY